MEDSTIEAIFEKVGAIKKGHFKLTSGLHSDTYVQCARIQEFPTDNNKLAAEAVHRLPDDIEIELVAAPAVGGIVFGYAVAAALGKRFVWSEREKGLMTLRRGFSIKPGEKVLVCEDVVTTGGSVQELIDLIEGFGGIVVAVVAMIDRGNERKFDKPYYPLLIKATPAWSEDECELCRQGVQIDSPGSRLISNKE